MSDVSVTVYVAVVALIIYTIRCAVMQVGQREVIIIERFGKFHKQLNAGLNFVIPLVDWPKKFSYRYVVSDSYGQASLVNQPNMTRIHTQDQVLDFPKQHVISRDNAFLEIDAVMNYKIVYAKNFIYRCNNLPHILSKLLQAQLRNVAGSLDFDQMIEEAGSLNVLTGLMDSECARWGVKVNFVKVQRVDYTYNPELLSKVKDAELKNKEVVISAKAQKQTQIIEAEGKRDSMIKMAEGEASEMLARAKGQAQEVLNKASAEARSIREIGNALKAAGEANPTKYLYALCSCACVIADSILPVPVLS